MDVEYRLINSLRKIDRIGHEQTDSRSTLRPTIRQDDSEYLPLSGTNEDSTNKHKKKVMFIDGSRQENSSGVQNPSDHNHPDD